MNISIVQAMIDAIDKPAIFINPSYVIEAVNQPYRDTYPVDIKLGFSTCYQVSHRNNKPCDKCGEHCPMQESKTTGRAASVVHVHTTSEGQSYCDILMRPIFDGSGELLGFLEILDKLSFASNQPSVGKMVGESEAFKAMLNKINRAANSDISVLLFGETGTGKELVAHWLHEKSERANGPMVEVNCAAIPSELIESELFGHVKGAFTSANKDRAGKFEAANGGTIFLDEIGDMSLSAQAKVLRALQESKVSRVGSDKDIKVDVRVLAATNKNLKKEIEDGKFREDLYHRLAVILIPVPALNDRRDDIPLLVDHFSNKVAQEQGTAVKNFTSDAIKKLQEYDWTGNIRELRNVVERLIILGGIEVSEEDVKLFASK